MSESKLLDHDKAFQLVYNHVDSRIAASAILGTVNPKKSNQSRYASEIAIEAIQALIQENDLVPAKWFATTHSNEVVLGIHGTDSHGGQKVTHVITIKANGNWQDGNILLFDIRENIL